MREATCKHVLAPKIFGKHAIPNSSFLLDRPSFFHSSFPSRHVAIRLSFLCKRLTMAFDRPAFIPSVIECTIRLIRPVQAPQRNCKSLKKVSPNQQYQRPTSSGVPSRYIETRSISNKENWHISWHLLRFG